VSVPRCVGDALRVEHPSADGTFPAVLRFRLLPIVPFDLLNLACGLARIPFRSYAAVTVLGMLPGTAIITYIVDSVPAGAAGARPRASAHTAPATLLLLALSFAPRLIRSRD
jgi:uncharacterized membrane protein YdjX (TVP38/TMEM64 family)